MKHNGTKVIQTERLMLREFTMDDAEAMYQNWAKDAEVTKFLRWQPHANLDVTRELLRQWVSSYEDPSYYSWLIVLKDENVPIGSIGIFDVSEMDESAEIGYCMGKNWWGKGLMTEALKAVIQFGFEEVGFNRLEAFYNINNPASGRVMQKAGVKLEGIAKQKYSTNLGFYDCNMYSILKQEYLK
jgi:ribosomal-protein-alanine N-acetyltransferase